MKTKPFTQEYRDQLVELCICVADEFGIDCKTEDELRAMSDVDLDLESDWYWELSLK
jgi:hypothetical protein